MIIRCTKKLLDKMNRKPAGGEIQHEFFCWYANLITVNRHNTVVFYNEATGSVLVLSNLRVKDFTHLEAYFLGALRNYFEDCGFDESLLDCYLGYAGSELSFRKTENRSAVATLNRICTEIPYADELDETQIIQRGLNYSIRSRLFSDAGDYKFSDELFVAKLGALCTGGVNALLAHRPALYIRANLYINEAFVIKRELLIPEHMKYSSIHKVLQAAFGWAGYHPHEFCVYANGASFYYPSPKKVYVMRDSRTTELSGEEERLFESERLNLDDLKQDSLHYVYDFGDNWEIELEYVETIADHSGTLPCCIGGSGDAPPEDCGGCIGYLDFLKVIADPLNPECQAMREWGESQGFESFDIKRINARLRRIREFD